MFMHLQFAPSRLRLRQSLVVSTSPTKKARSRLGNSAVAPPTSYLLVGRTELDVVNHYQDLTHGRCEMRDSWLMSLHPLSQFLMLDVLARGAE